MRLPTACLALLLCSFGCLQANAGDVPIDALGDWAHYNNTGHMAERRGNLDRAAQAFRIAIEAIRPYQSHHPALMTRSNADYARVLVAMGRPAEAEPLARWVVASRKVDPTAKPYEIGKDLNSLALILMKLDRGKEAEPLLKEALEKLGRAEGPLRVEYLTTLESLGALATEQGKHDQAASYFRRALLARQATNTESQRLAETAEFSAAILRLTNRTIAAETYEGQAKALRDSSAESIGAAVATENLATVLRKSGKEDEAEELLAKARTLRDHLATKAARARETGPLIGVGSSR